MGRVADSRRQRSNQRGPRRTSARSVRARLSERLPDPALARARSASARVARFGSRLTGRAAILVVVLAVLIVSYASSLKAYLNQRHDTKTLQTQIAQRQQHIDELQDQLDRWKDPAYVEQQARVRFGYTKPGSTSYVALDEHGNKIESSVDLDDPKKVGRAREPVAWWENAWSSVKVAGNPPKSGAAQTIGSPQTSSKEE